MTIQVKAIEQYFHVVLFIMLCKIVLTFKSVDEILVYDHSNERYCSTFMVLFIMLYKRVVTFKSVDETTV